jgi:phage shock protein PspC (stress-responsive transcriptional regulator)
MESTQQTQQQQQPAPMRPRLERLRRDRAIAGVASGLARYLGVEVAWVRIGFVVSALFGGMGVLAYLIGWLAIPEEGETESIAVDKASDFQSAGSWIGIGLIVLAAMIVLGNTGLIAGELIFAAVLVAVGVLLYRGDIGGPKRPPASIDFQTDAAETVPAAEPATAATVVDTVEPPLPSYAVPPPPRTPPLPPDPAFQPRPMKPREPSVLGRFALASILIVVGVMGIGQSAGWFEPTLRHYSAAVLVVLGGFLLVSSLFGRARWLIVLGLVLAPLLLAMALLKVPFEGGFGDPRYTPTAVAEVNAEYRLVAGQMVLDLTNLEITDGDLVELEASVVFGRLEVILPADVGVNAAALVDAGEIFVDGVRQSQVGAGTSNNVNMERAIVYEGAGQLSLEAHVGFGELSLRQPAEVTP